MPKAESRQDKGCNQALARLSWAAGASNFSNVRKPSPALWGPRKTTIQEDQQLCSRGYKEAPNKGPVHGLSYGSTDRSLSCARVELLSRVNPFLSCLHCAQCMRDPRHFVHGIIEPCFWIGFSVWSFLNSTCVLPGSSSVRS